MTSPRPKDLFAYGYRLRKSRASIKFLDEEEEIALKEFARFEEKLRQQKGPDAAPSTVGKGSLDTVRMR